MLTPDTHGPIVQVGEVCIDGGRLALGLAAPGDRLIVLVACADPSLLKLDLQAVAALRGMLMDAEPLMELAISAALPPE